MDKATIINDLIRSKGYDSYLEIGIQEHITWNQIVCGRKVGIEPIWNTGDERIIKATSDEFFADSEEKFDLIFIDGDHNEDAVSRDITNSLLSLKEGGTIVLHDAFPPNLEHTISGYCGTVYRAIWKARLLGGVSVLTWAGDYGVCLMKKTGESPIGIAVGDYQSFVENVGTILNLRHDESTFTRELANW